MINNSWQKRAVLKGSVASAAISVAMFAATAAYAQDAVSEDTETIIVTGSLIKNPNLVRSSPVSVTSAEEIDLKQSNTAESLLRDVPGLVPGIGSSVNNGNGGVSTVNLRNLGDNRNIVLLDGNRLAPASLSGVFDLNNVPLALIERVDILTGGASTTYGADAISGVVNFVTKQDFAGVEASASYGLTERGDGNTLRADLTMGANFDDGRGNVTLSLGYQEADPVYFNDRDFSRYSYTSETGVAGGSGTAALSRFSGLNPSAGDWIANPTAEGADPICYGANEAPVEGLVQCANPQSGQREVLADGTGIQAGNGFNAFNFNPYNVFQTPFKRFNIFSSARYEVSENLEFYGRGIFSKNKVQTIVAPSGAFGLTVDVPLNNPFLSDDMRNAFCARDTNSGIGYTPLFTAAECAAAANPDLKPGDEGFQSVQTTLYRRNVEGGPRISTYDTTFFDYRAGVRGAVTSTINYDVSASYGETENVATSDGYWINSRVKQGLFANGDGCIGGDANCVPIDLFGENTVTPEMNNFLSDKSVTISRFSLTQVRGGLSGDFGFAIPSASDAVAFAVGAEYRKYTASREADLLSRSGELGGAGGAEPNMRGAYEVSEIYGELVVPVIQDRPFFEDLTIEGGARYSKYSVDAPNNPSYDTFTWKAGGSWTPGAGLKIRGNYAKAVRAPNISELYTPATTLLTNLGDDPCANLDNEGLPIAGRPVPSGELLNICLAQGAPESAIGSIGLPTSGQANYVFSGNLNLKPETSTSWTVGAVWQPHFAPGLSITADYYNITVKNSITGMTPGDAMDACFGSNWQSPSAGASLTEACQVINRHPTTGMLSGDSMEVSGLYLPLTNAGRLEVAGVDFTVSYGHDFGNIGWNIAASGSWTEKSTFQATPSLEARDCVGKYSVNCASLQPEWQWSVRNTFQIGDVDLSLLWRHMSKMKYEYGDLFQGQLTGGNLDGKTVNFNEIPSYNIFDLTTRFNVSENFDMTLVISNLFDKKPSMVGGEAGATAFNGGNIFPSSYDALGRRFNITARVKF